MLLGVVCCDFKDFKDDFSIIRFLVLFVWYLVIEGMEEIGVGKDEVNEEEVVIFEGIDKFEDLILSYRDFLVVYSEEIRRYEN